MLIRDSFSFWIGVACGIIATLAVLVTAVLAGVTIGARKK